MKLYKDNSTKTTRSIWDNFTPSKPVWLVTQGSMTLSINLKNCIITMGLEWDNQILLKFLYINRWLCLLWIEDSVKGWSEKLCMEERLMLWFSSSLPRGFSLSHSSSGRFKWKGKWEIVPRFTSMLSFLRSFGTREIKIKEKPLWINFTALNCIVFLSTKSSFFTN